MPVRLPRDQSRTTGAHHGRIKCTAFRRECRILDFSKIEAGHLAFEEIETADRIKLHTTIRDSGIGIPEDKLEQIFEAFKQADGSTTRKYGGTGLGLSICKKIAEQMGGDVWVESQLGVGSLFHCTAWFNKTEGKKAAKRCSTFSTNGSLTGMTLQSDSVLQTPEQLIRKQTPRQIRAITSDHFSRSTPV